MTNKERSYFKGVIIVNKSVFNENWVISKYVPKKIGTSTDVTVKIKPKTVN